MRNATPQKPIFTRKILRNVFFELETLWLKLLHSKRTKKVVYFTSDWHFSHHNVIVYCDRPFVSLKSMNSALVRRWNAMVKDQDKVYFLGDFSMNKNRMKEFTPQLRGTKFLVPGNHDEAFAWNGRANPKKVAVFAEAGWHVFTAHTTRNIGKYSCVLSHFPYGDEEAKKYDTRYFEYRPLRGEEDFIIHGHQHVKILKSGNRIDVGIDNNFRLYSEADLIKLMEDKRDFIPSRITNHYNKNNMVNRENNNSY